MKYCKGEEIMYIGTGQLGIITSVDEINNMYHIDIDGIEYSVEEYEIK